jgi:glycosyltransferase involved in cell wall biosynthesis
VFHDPEGTIASVRNEVANQAKGEWLLFLDADDELAPGFLDAMMTAYSREREYRNGHFLLTPAVQQIRKGRPGKPFFFPECDLTTGNWMVVGTLVERELFREIGGFREFSHGLEDWNLWARCVRHGAIPVKVEKAVYRAYFNTRSKHHVFMRNRSVYMVEYEAARVDAWG